MAGDGDDAGGVARQTKWLGGAFQERPDDDLALAGAGGQVIVAAPGEGAHVGLVGQEERFGAGPTTVPDEDATPEAPA